MVLKKKKVPAVFKVLRNQSGAALIGITIVVSVVIAFFILNSVKTAKLTSDLRGQSRRQLFVQEIFQNAAVIVHDAYQSAKSATLNGTACPSGGAPTPTSVSGFNLCLPPSPANCLANPEMPGGSGNPGNPICLVTSTTGNGLLSFAPVPTKPGFFANFKEQFEKIELFLSRFDFSAGIPDAHAEVSQLPVIPAAFVPVIYPGAAAPGQTCGVGLACVTIRVCLVVNQCPTGASIATDPSYYQTIGIPFL